MLKELYENVMDQEYSDSWDDITEEQLKAFEDALRKDYEDGVPSADFRGDEKKSVSLKSTRDLKKKFLASGTLTNRSGQRSRKNSMRIS